MIDVKCERCGLAVGVNLTGADGKLLVKLPFPEFVSRCRMEPRPTPTRKCPDLMLPSRSDGALQQGTRPMSIIQDLHDSEINAAFTFQSIYDGVFEVQMGDPLNGIDEKAIVGTWAEAEAWYREKAIVHYPHSTFAKKYQATPSVGV